MATLATSTPSTPEPAHLQAARPDDADSLWAEWGYEAADPALQARLWGEPLISLEDRRS